MHKVGVPNYYFAQMGQKCCPKINVFVLILNKTDFRVNCQHQSLPIAKGTNDHSKYIKINSHFNIYIQTISADTSNASSWL